MITRTRQDSTGIEEVVLFEFDAAFCMESAYKWVHIKLNPLHIVSIMSYSLTYQEMTVFGVYHGDAYKVTDSLGREYLVTKHEDIERLKRQ